MKRHAKAPFRTTNKKNFGELEEYETEDEEERVEVEKEDELDETMSSIGDNFEVEELCEDYDFGLEQCGYEDVTSSNSESDGESDHIDSETDANESNDEEDEEEEDDDEELYEDDRGTIIVEGEDMDHRLLALVTFYCKEGLSEKCMKRMLALMAIVYGEKAPFSINDIKKVVRNMGKNVIDSVSYYCNKCAKKKNFKEEKCAECKENRCEVLNRVTLVQCNVFWQLEEELRSKGIEIIEGHKTIHYGTGELLPEDIRNFSGYTSKMESKEEFEKGTVNLIFSVFSDGAVFKSLSRREVTPVLMRLEGINVESKSGGNNFVMVSMVFADGGVKKEFADTFVEKSFCNLPKYVNVDVNGRTWTFRLKIMSFLADMKERKMLTRLPNWHQIMGCSECLTEGKKKRSGTVSYNNFNKFSHRTDYTIMRDSSEGINGFNGSKEILKPHHWVHLKMKTGSVEAIVNCIDSIVPYTYDPVPLVSMRKSSKSTGRETEKKAIIMSGLVWQEAFCTSNDYNALMCGLYYSFMCQANMMCDSTSLNKLLAKVYQLHATLEPDSITIKYHVGSK
ncbi:hypothetical protein GCK72_015639 [Caenorhabditis remanei]|uniref:Uncharacterized protein n=1 Tax=Caenorhabditis remanei TaxID=31234 RepID=A0A6A5GUL9_CAERE|nr:hypothetical protein GCK72_015639 [Caenorhabditis remanei]KAF1759178.1 hypothetical protein GCK72_015639 [Caenorhabditis remanei]